jgi:hypothetical protein
MSGQIQPPAALTRKEASHCTHCIGEWVGPESALTLWKRYKSLAVAGIRTPIILYINENASIPTSITVMRQRRNEMLWAAVYSSFTLCGSEQAVRHTVLIASGRISKVQFGWKHIWISLNISYKNIVYYTPYNTFRRQLINWYRIIWNGQADETSYKFLCIRIQKSDHISCICLHDRDLAVYAFRVRQRDRDKLLLQWNSPT